MKTIIFVLILIISNTAILAIDISGVVIDVNNNPIPFVNVTVKGTTLGTITNNSGYFSLKLSDNNNNQILVFSFIGYSNEEYKISDIKAPITVRLIENILELEEVIINPDSTMFTLLSKAYKKIPENYGKDPTILMGFFRETLKEKDSSFIYIAESVIESYKTSYSNKQKGQVRVLKTRKNLDPNGLSKNNVKFYGSLFVAHDADIVHNKEGVINPNNFSKYSYNYNGLMSYGDKVVYSFSFNKKDHDISGNFYIEKESLAYVYFDYFSEEARNTSNFNINRTKKNFKIQYTDINGLWFLKSCIYSSELYNKTKKTNLVLTYDYVTTDVKYNDIQGIKYSDQIKPTTIFSDIATTYKDSYWKDYNILAQDTVTKTNVQLQFNNSTSDSLLNVTHKQKITGLDLLLSIVNKLYIDFDLSYSDYSFPVNSTKLLYKKSELVNNNIESTPNIVFTNLLGYKLTNKLSLEYSSSENMTKKLITKSNKVGFAYIIPLKSNGKQFFAQPDLSYYNSYNGYLLGFAKMPDDTKINNISFKKGANIYSGKKYQGVSAGITFKTDLTAMFHFVIGCNYNYAFETKNALLVKEKSGLYKRKTYQSFDEDVEYYENEVAKNGSSFNLDNWSFKLGIRFEL